MRYEFDFDTLMYIHCVYFQKLALYNFLKETDFRFAIYQTENNNLEDDEYDSEDCENGSQDSDEVFDEVASDGDLRHTTSDNDEVY